MIAYIGYIYVHNKSFSRPCFVIVKLLCFALDSFTTLCTMSFIFLKIDNLDSLIIVYENNNIKHSMASF